MKVKWSHRAEAARTSTCVANHDELCDSTWQRTAAYRPTMSCTRQVFNPFAPVAVIGTEPGTDGGT